MFKWFRKYNKVLLVVGGCFLMVAFLVPTAFSKAGRNANNPVIGHIGDEEVHIGQRQKAAYDLELIRSVFGSVHPWLGQIVEPDAHRWMLMNLDADRLGISAGDPEVAELLAALKADPDEPLDQFVARLTAQYDITEGYLYVALADWLRIEKYKEIQRGQTHTPVRLRLLKYINLFNEMSKTLEKAPPYLRQLYMNMFMQRMIRVDHSEPRVSRPLLERFAVDAGAMVTIAAVPVSYKVYLSRVQTPDDQRISELFNKYKGDLSGTSVPYGLGYKYPHRAKIEYLTIPIARMIDSITIEETDAIRYYDQNIDEFTSTPQTPKPKEGEDAATAEPPKPVIKPYKQVRSEIIDRLRREAAQEKADQLIRSAQSMLLDDAGSLDTRDGYRIVQDGWKPMSLATVAQRIQKRYGILPDVTRIDDRWLDRQQLEDLKGIGSATLPGKRGVTFAGYVLAARQFAPDKASPLMTLRLQTDMPSLPLVALDGSRYLFRVIDASRAHEPATLDEVRDQVVEDARKLAAYKLLLDDRANWAKRLDTETLDQLAVALKAKIITTEPFPRRRMGRNGTLGPPDIAGIGADIGFVDAVYEIADAAVSNDKPIDQIPAAQRSAPVASDHNLALYLTRIDAYKPLTPAKLKQQFNDTSAGLFIQASLLGPDAADPLSVESIVKRLNYVAEKDDRQGDEEDEDTR